MNRYLAVVVLGVSLIASAAPAPPGQEPPYVLVVLTRGEVEAEVARRAVADVSRMIWRERRGG